MKNNNSTDAPEQRICRADNAGLPAHSRKGKKPTEAVLDLLGDAVTSKRTNDKPEAAALHEVMLALRAHPAVCWVERMNTGAARIGNRFVKFGFTGCPDVLGQLTDGRMLGVEVKAPKGKLRPEQAVMLERINGAGGLGFVAHDLRDVHRVLTGPGGIQSLQP